MATSKPTDKNTKAYIDPAVEQRIINMLKDPSTVYADISDELKNAQTNGEIIKSLGDINGGSFAYMNNMLSRLAPQAGIQYKDLKKWKDDSYKRNVTDKQGNYGTFVNNLGKTVTATSLKMAQDMKTLGFPMTKSGTSGTAAEKASISGITSTQPRQDLQLIADGKATNIQDATSMVNTGTDYATADAKSTQEGIAQANAANAQRQVFSSPEEELAAANKINAANGYTVGGGANGDVVRLPNGQMVSRNKAIEMGLDPSTLESVSTANQIKLPSGAIIDTTGLPQSTVDSLTNLNQHLTDQGANGQAVNPALNITPEMTQKYVDAAHAAYKPYYDQLYGQGKADVTKGIQRTAEDYQTSVNKIGQDYGKNLEATQENFAKRGLNFSTDRNRAEGTLASSANTAIGNEVQAAMRDANDIGTKSERILGSSMMPTNLASINSGYTAGLGQPGQYGLNTGNQSRQLFNPLGGQIGDYERNQSSDERNWAAEAIAAKRKLYGGIAYPNEYNQLT